MCSSLLQLAPGSRDVSQAEKRITVVTGLNTTLFSLKMVLGEILSESSCHYVNLLSLQQQLFFSQLEINHMIQQPSETD